MRLPSLLGVASVLHSPVPQLNHRFPAPVSVSSGSAREVFLALLSQRAVQTQLFYNQQFKNDFQRSWLQRYAAGFGLPQLNLQGGRMLHVVDAMLGVGEKDEFLLKMMGAPDEEHEVVVVWGSRVGGGSPNNPYLKPKTEERTYVDTISPAKIARQLMAIREELAREWTEDLRLIKLDNKELRRHHAEEVRNLIDNEERFQYANAPDATSPLRSSSFDLLKTASTRCALRRLHSELDRDGLQRHSAEWIRVFVEARGNPLSGELSWHAARTFLLDLMEQPVSVSTSLGGQPRFLDPLALAERLLDLRVEITEEWTEILQDVPDQHLRLERNRMLQREVGETGEAMVRQLQLLERPPPKGFQWGGCF